ncbi:MAG: hypothetical protein HQK99_05220 [Nitrospirae bacterium]|nr:hypothetical protein [Nitrospirota bacterium]
MKNRGFSTILLLLFVVLMASTAYAGPKIWLDKTNFGPGENITVHFTASSSYDSDAWIGIIPSEIPHGEEEVNDKYDVAYQYLNKRSSGTLVFAAPVKTGSWDFRMNDTDKNGKEVASVTFTVGSASQGPGSSGNREGDPVSVKWKGTWYPAHVLKAKGDQTYIHYDGYDNSWDEWVGPDRIKSAR